MHGFCVYKLSYICGDEFGLINDKRNDKGGC